MYTDEKTENMENSSVLFIAVALIQPISQFMLLKKRLLTACRNDL